MRLSQSVGLGIRVVATFVLAMCAAGAASAQEASDELWGTPTYLDDVIISGPPVQRGGEDMARWEDIWAAIYDADLPASADSDSPLPSDRQKQAVPSALSFFGPWHRALTLSAWFFRCSDTAKG